MFSALISFLGGSVFRMIWGEVSHFWTEKQSHDQEIERMRVQGELDAAQHARELESIKVQADLGVKTIQVQAQAAVDVAEAQAWAVMSESTTKITGITFIDVWNGMIRPLLATLAISMVVANIAQHGFALDDWDKELIGAILGLYVADRALAHRGK